MIRLLVVDEHPVVGEGIRAILANEPDVSIRVVEDLDSATQTLDAQVVDVVLSEVQLHGRNGGLELLRLRGRGGPPIIMFSAQSFPSNYADAVGGGAAGFLSKTAPPSEIVRAIRIVAAGGKVFSSVAFDLARAARRRPARRELEIVALVATGATNAEVAHRLSIGLPTVEGVLRRLFDRYGVRNRTALARLAENEGWLFGSVA